MVFEDFEVGILVLVLVLVENLAASGESTGMDYGFRISGLTGFKLGGLVPWPDASWHDSRKDPAPAHVGVLYASALYLSKYRYT